MITMFIINYHSSFLKYFNNNNNNNNDKNSKYLQLNNNTRDSERF